MFRWFLFGLFLSLSFTAGSLGAQEVRPAIIYDTELIMDGSWNEAILKGIKKFEKRTGVPVKIEIARNYDEHTQKMNDFAKQGYNPILLSGSILTQKKIRKAVIDHPKTRFIIFNGIFNLPNAYYFSFSYHTSSFLAGYLSAAKTKSGKLGFIGGMEIPTIKNFLCGYIAGAKYQNPDIQVEHTYVGHDSNAWTRPDRAREIALEQIERGADVIFSPSGGSSIGALKAAHEKSVLGVGVDMNQNHLYPGSILTSVMVRVDNAAYRALMTAHRNIWGEQRKVMGLQEKGVELAFDQHNEGLIPSALKKEIEQLESDIILGKVTVPYYEGAKECLVNGKTLFK
ncbi:putative outer membrane basic protein [Candidatus Terasakiella magnetica]|uniref:Putative outer membrane basic protein n=1 Tax=Candidatus Terasakiella magnetica TaxID=1867952 RepID=A0A1C3RJ12_9PROT|nr:BMP family ABC transporter substrate-binding protein [Candidatus Terasakiella magnetica]SCA57250.1 putative outer membrane basic protein [Candidatus Terasakiella magnetica]